MLIRDNCHRRAAIVAVLTLVSAPAWPKVALAATILTSSWEGGPPGCGDALLDAGAWGAFGSSDACASQCNGGGPDASVVSNAEIDGGQALEIVFPPNAACGINGPDFRVERFFGVSYGEIFARWHVRWSPEWSWASADHKVAIFGGERAQNVYFNIRGQTDDTRGRVAIGVTPSDVVFSDPSHEITRGDWHTFEIHIVAGGQGSVEARVDGVDLALVAEAGNLGFEPSNVDTGPSIDFIKLDTTYNDYQHVISLDTTMRVQYDAVALNDGDGWIGPVSSGPSTSASSGSAASNASAAGAGGASASSAGGPVGAGPATGGGAASDQGGGDPAGAESNGSSSCAVAPAAPEKPWLVIGLFGLGIAATARRAQRRSALKLASWLASTLLSVSGCGEQTETTATTASGGSGPSAVATGTGTTTTTTTSGAATTAGPSGSTGTSGTGGNLPSLLFENGWENRTEVGCNYNGLVDGDGGVSTNAWMDYGPSSTCNPTPPVAEIVTDETHDGGRALRVNYVPDPSQSNGPDFRIGQNFPSQSEVYARWWIKYSDSWVWAGANHKLAIFGSTDGEGTQDIYYNVRGMGDGGPGYVVIHVIPSDTLFEDANTNMAPNVWHLCELHIVSGAHGRVEAKLDGQLLNLTNEFGFDPMDLDTGANVGYIKLDTTYNDYAYPAGLGLEMQSFYDSVAVSNVAWIGGNVP